MQSGNTIERLVWQAVMKRFPKIEQERTCMIERRAREAARNSYYNRLINDPEAKKRILAENGEDPH